MKKYFISTLILIALFSSCNQKNVQNEATQIEMTKAAEISNEKISELPLGFKFGMCPNEVSEILYEMVRDSVLDLYNNSLLTD